MKKFSLCTAIAVLVCCVLSFTLSAQEWKLEEEQNTETTLEEEVTDEVIEDSVPIASILLIPFEPRMYLSDAERDIAKATKKQPEVNQRYFRYQVERSLVNRIQRSYGVKSLYFDTTQSAEDDMIELYSKVTYAYREPIMPETKRVFMKIKKKDKPDPESIDPVIATKYRHSYEDAEYMSATISDVNVLQEMNEKYGTELFLFITQFEIKTNYNNCLDIANKIYQREVIWHYSLLDKNGNIVLGNFAKAEFPSDSNNAAKIVYSCFPKLAHDIVTSIP